MNETGLEMTQTGFNNMQKDRYEQNEPAAELRNSKYGLTRPNFWMLSIYRWGDGLDLVDSIMTPLTNWFYHRSVTSDSSCKSSQMDYDYRSAVWHEESTDGALDSGESTTCINDALVITERRYRELKLYTWLR